MKLNMPILGEALKPLGFTGIFTKKLSELPLSSFSALSELPEKTEDDIVYIVEKSSLPSTPARNVPQALIVVGRPPEAWLAGAGEILYCEAETRGLLEVIETVNRTFHRYQQWENRVLEEIDRNAPLYAIGKVSMEFFANPIFASGAGYEVFFTLSPDKVTPSELYNEYRKINGFKPGEIFSHDLINMLIADSDYNDAVHSKDVTLYPGKPFGYPSLYYNLQVNDVAVGRVMIDAVLNPITDSDYGKVKILGQFLEKALAKQSTYPYEYYPEMSRLIQDMLEEVPVDAEQAERIVSERKWKREDHYLCMSIWLGTKDNPISALGPIALKITQFLGDHMSYVVYEGTIVVLYNLTASRKEWDQLLEYVLPLFRDSMLKASFSHPFRDFNAFPYFYRQTVLARKLGEKKDPMRWYFRMDSYLMDYYRTRCLEDMIPEAVIPSGLNRLIQYDEKKGTEYVRLLRIYLHYDGSIADTVREMYIHRNTFLYRIEKIEKILGMNLKKAEVRMVLRMALHLI